MAALSPGLTCVSGAVWNYFWRVPWSHGGDFGVVRMYMVSKIQTVIFPKVVPSSLGASRCPHGLVSFKKQWVDQQEVSVDMHRRTLGEDG